MKKLILLALAGTTIWSCNALQNTEQQTLAESRWQLADEVKGKQPTMVFEAERITGNGGCNNYFGQYTSDPKTGSFSAKNVGSTKMACHNDNVEANFFKMLPKVNKYKVKGNSLELYQDDLLLLKFNKM